MKEITEANFAEIIEGNSENLNLEFKDTFDFNQDTWARERLIRAVLAMSNTRNGGYIIVGIHENEDKSYDFSGVDEDHLTLFRTKEEALKAMIESFSSASALYEIGICEYKGRKFLLLNVTEFLIYPLICKKDGDHKNRLLEAGAIYVRTLKDKPSSIKLTNHVDVEDLFKRATDKQILDLHKRGWGHKTESTEDDKSFFEQERSNF